MPSWVQTRTQAELIEALYDALPPDKKVDLYNSVEKYSTQANCIAHYTDTTLDNNKIIEWYERALMGVRTKAQTAP